MNLKRSPFAIQDKNARDLDNVKVCALNRTFLLVD